MTDVRDVKDLKVIHIWDAYAPTLFDRTHPYLLAQPGFDSLLIAAHLIENQASVLPHTVYLDTRAVSDDILPPFWTRLRRRIRREASELVRSLARHRSPGSWLGSAPLTLSQFNRFCLTHTREFGGELIHAHFGTTAVRTLPFIRASGLPAIVTFYGVDGSASIRIPAWRESFREMFGRMSRVIVLCDAVRDRLLAIGCPPEKLLVWNLPAGVEDYPCKPRTTSGGPVRFLIGARFVEKKGHAYLLDAFESIIRDGVDARLTMIGYGPLKESIVASVHRRGLDSRIAVVDTQLDSSFADVYRSALDSHDIFVLPSTTSSSGDDEGGPALTMVCAQAAGLPAISTPFAGAERTMIDGVTGFLCRQDDAASLAERMRWLAGHPEIWNTIGKAASDLVRAEFSLAGQMTKLLEVYRAAAADPHGPRH